MCVCSCVCIYSTFSFLELKHRRYDLVTNASHHSVYVFAGSFARPNRNQQCRRISYILEYFRQPFSSSCLARTQSTSRSKPIGGDRWARKADEEKILHNHFDGPHHCSQSYDRRTRAHFITHRCSRSNEIRLCMLHIVSIVDRVHAYWVPSSPPPLFLLLFQNVRFQLSPEPEPDSRQKRIVKENKRSLEFACNYSKLCTFLLKCFSYLFSLLIFACPIALASQARVQHRAQGTTQTISSCAKCDVRADAHHTSKWNIKRRKNINDDERKSLRVWNVIFYCFTIYSFVDCLLPSPFSFRPFQPSTTRLHAAIVRH